MSHSSSPQGVVAVLGSSERWGIAVEPHWYVELDSSTPAKFSRHVTLRIPGAAFACNLDVGSFLARILASPKVPPQ